MTLTTPLTAALTKFLQASLCLMSLQQALADHVVERFEGEIRIDRAAAVADQQREMMHFARFAGFEHESNARPRAFANQMMMQAGNRQQRRNRRIVFIDAAIRQNQNVDAVFDRLAGLGAKFVHRFFETRFAGFRRRRESGA